VIFSVMYEFSCHFSWRQGKLNEHNYVLDKFLEPMKIVPLSMLRLLIYDMQSNNLGRSCVSILKFGSSAQQ
jgi:hypothetical protein